VFSELLWPFEIKEEGDSALLPGSQLLDDGLHLSILAGALKTDGLFSLRLAYQPSRYFFFEVNFNHALGDLGELQMLGLEMLVDIGPWNSIVPYVAVGSGVALALPHRNVELLEKKFNPFLTAGGGIFLAIGKSLTLRLDVRRNLLFSPEETWSAISVLGGLMVSY
jgi:hypothetical protein